MFLGKVSEKIIKCKEPINYKRIKFMFMKSTSMFWILFLLGGCATMNQSECLNADWQMIGIEDGSLGRAQSYIGQHRRACAKYNTTPDLFSYQAGHVEGLKQYCTPQRGFGVGKKGSKYNGVCPPNLEPNFLKGYNAGNKIYKVSRRIKNLTANINANRKKLKKAKEDVGIKEQLVISDKSTQQQRITLLAEIKELEKNIGRLEADILSSEKKKAVAQAKLQKLTRTSYY